MSLDEVRAFKVARPSNYPAIPAPIARKNWSKQADLPGPNPLLSDWLTLTFIKDTPAFLNDALIAKEMVPSTRSGPLEAVVSVLNKTTG